MVRASEKKITALLLRWRAGDHSALERLIPLVYDELRSIARRCMRGERVASTLQPTALVNEAYLRLIRVERVDWRDRVHFFAVVSNIMRRVLVDEARRRGVQKRGGECTRVALGEASAVAPAVDVDVLALERALEMLATTFPRKCRVVELRYFGGLTIEETAMALGVSIDIVKREWRTARMWLQHAIEEEIHGSHAVAAH
jgi:RNA polymerase sigma-70 factor, ECF subfamily